jgi:predicted DNA-binding protein
MTFRAPADLVAKVDAYAIGAGMTKSEAIRRLVEKGLEA